MTDRTKEARTPFILEREVQRANAEYFAHLIPAALSRNYVAASHEERAEMTKTYLDAYAEIHRLAVRMQREREAK